MAANVGGYDLNWLEDPPDDLKCLICLCVARDPHQHPGDATNECGKVFCHSCITEYQKNKTTCPNCRKNLTHFKYAKSKSQSRSIIMCMCKYLINSYITLKIAILIIRSMCVRVLNLLNHRL